MRRIEERGRGVEALVGGVPHAPAAAAAAVQARHHAVGGGTLVAAAVVPLLLAVLLLAHCVRSSRRARRISGCTCLACGVLVVT